MAGVGRPAETGVLGEVPQDEDRGLPGDTLGLAEDVLVGYQVADDEDPPTLEPLDRSDELGGLRARHGGIVAAPDRIGPWRDGLPGTRSSAPLYWRLTGGKALLWRAPSRTRPPRGRPAGTA